MPSRVESVPIQFDVAVVGAGVVGAAIARALSFFDITIALIDAADDVGAATSKANSAILHTGFDATPGSLESNLVRRGHAMLTQYAPTVGIALEQTGALVIAWSAEQVSALDTVMTTALENGYESAVLLSAEQVYEREPLLGPGALGAVLVPDESIICPFTTPLAFATEAVVNGTTLFLESPMTEAARTDGSSWLLSCGQRKISARWVVNAAGLHSDVVARIMGRPQFEVHPRRGQFVVFDKHARDQISGILLSVPGPSGKGVLVAPTVFGNVLLGPTAEDLTNKSATETTGPGLEFLLQRGSEILPGLSEFEVTATYAGLRAVSSAGNYDIDADRDAGYARAVGIRSTGLTGSMAIADHLVQHLVEAGLELRPKPDHQVPKMPYIGEQSIRPHRDQQAIEANPDAGKLICWCELVSAAEVDATLVSPIPPRSIDGLRRRTRATAGRCQGFYCGAAVASWFDRNVAGSHRPDAAEDMYESA